MSGLFWPIFWILGMLALVVATTVVGLKEKKARDAALKKMQPKPLDAGFDPDADPMAAEAELDNPEVAEFGEGVDEADFAAVDEETADK
jgi:hypothetical protein